MNFSNFKQLLKDIIKEQILDEIKEEEFSDIKICSAASSHSLQTCKIGDRKYFLKYGGWDDEGIKKQTEYNLQIGVEYLAYQIYKLFGISIPEDIHVVSKPDKKRIGIATSAVAGKTASLNKKLKGQLTNGMYVDMLLANWDIGNIENLISTDNDVIRIDPGGSLVFRAQGERKRTFSKDVEELSTMHPDKGFTPAAKSYDAALLKKAAETFNKVSSVSELATTIDIATNKVAEIMEEANISKANIAKWTTLVNNEIKPILLARFEKIKDSADFVLET